MFFSIIFVVDNYVNILLLRWIVGSSLPEIGARIETGAKMILRNQKVDTYSEEYDAISQQYIENNLANFLYSYDEQIYSLYGIFGQQLGKFKYQGGIRLEKSYQIPNLISDTIRIVNDYFNFFPSAHFHFLYFLSRDYLRLNH